jgi:stage II sporulation protein D
VTAAAATCLAGCACEQPGRKAVTAPGVPLVRVKLGDDARAVSVAVKGPWGLTGDAGPLASGDALDWTSVIACEGKAAFGTAPPAAGAIELRAKDDAGVWVRQTVDGKERTRCYRGVVRIAPTADGALSVINTLPMETYLAGVLANELIPGWPLETYKAQAVAARTFALGARNSRTGKDFDVYDSTSSQVYCGAATENQRAWKAVEDTWGIVAATRGADGKPVLLKTYYHSTCGGETAPAGVVFGGTAPAPLAGGVKCSYCRKSPKFTWPEVVLKKKEIGEAMARAGGVLAQLGGIRSVEAADRISSGGRARTVRIVGASGAAVLVDANKWRVLVGARKMPSTWFDIEDRGDAIALTSGRGYGHGVGLCQWGAAYLAERGMKGEQILRYYYPGVDLVRAY